jgi:hypothetical protein
MAVSLILDRVRRREDGNNSGSSFSAIGERKNELTPHTLFPFRRATMNDDLQKKLLEVDTRIKYEANQQTLDIRDWYEQLPPEERVKFQEQVKALAAIADRFELDWRMFVKVHCSWTQYDENGEVIWDAGGTRRPQDLLQAIAQWDEYAANEKNQ